MSAVSVWMLDSCLKRPCEFPGERPQMIQTTRNTPEFTVICARSYGSGWRVVCVPAPLCCASGMVAALPRVALP